VTKSGIICFRDNVMANGKPTLSLCMIVRDAERSLGAALASAKPFVDEMVVADTGSVDQTREIARDCGARVSNFAWCDDFSAARNYSIGQATGDWILWMDADEVLPPESGRVLREAIAACPGRDAAFWVACDGRSAHQTLSQTPGNSLLLSRS
jgi:glycosyltransferase involved in cell wall biosynthesis